MGCVSHGLAGNRFTSVKLNIFQVLGLQRRRYLETVLCQYKSDIILNKKDFPILWQSVFTSCTLLANIVTWCPIHILTDLWSLCALISTLSHKNSTCLSLSYLNAALYLNEYCKQKLSLHFLLTLITCTNIYPWFNSHWRKLMAKQNSGQK